MMERIGSIHALDHKSNTFGIWEKQSHHKSSNASTWVVAVSDGTNEIGLSKTTPRRAAVLLSLPQGPAFEVFPVHRRI